MLLARVEGNVVATRKHPSFEGWRFVICQPINGAGEPEGAPQDRPMVVVQNWAGRLGR